MNVDDVTGKEDLSSELDKRVWGIPDGWDLQQT